MATETGRVLVLLESGNIETRDFDSTYRQPLQDMLDSKTCYHSKLNPRTYNEKVQYIREWAACKGVEYVNVGHNYEHHSLNSFVACNGAWNGGSLQLQDDFPFHNNSATYNVSTWRRKEGDWRQRNPDKWGYCAGESIDFKNI
jgi:hypothetical protein